MAVVALVDCNNFYASCERIFQPRLRGEAIVVLSNNEQTTTAVSTVRAIPFGTNQTILKFYHGNLQQLHHHSDLCD